MGFPEIRMRRLRTSAICGAWCARRLSASMTWSIPCLSGAGKNLKEPIPSMTDCFHFSPDRIADETAEAAKLGIPAVLLFGLPEKKDERGSEAWSESGAVQQAIARHQGPHARTCWSSPTSACANTPARPLRRHQGRPRRQRRHAASCSPRSRCPTPRPAPTSSRRRT